MDLHIDSTGHFVMLTKIEQAYYFVHFWKSANELVPAKKYILVAWLCQRWVITRTDRLINILVFYERP